MNETNSARWGVSASVRHCCARRATHVFHGDQDAELVLVVDAALLQRGLRHQLHGAHFAGALVRLAPHGRERARAEVRFVAPRPAGETRFAARVREGARWAVEGRRQTVLREHWRGGMGMAGEGAMDGYPAF